MPDGANLRTALLALILSVTLANFGFTVGVAMLLYGLNARVSRLEATIDRHTGSPGDSGTP